MTMSQINTARAAPRVVPQTCAEEKNNAESLPVQTTHREQIILFSIGERRRYGLEIIRAIEECSNGAEKLSVGSLYPLLQSLERKKLVASEWGEDTPEIRGGARRRYYELTELGHRTLAEILEFQHRLRHWENFDEK